MDTVAFEIPIGLLEEMACAKIRKATLLGCFYDMPLGYSLLAYFYGGNDLKIGYIRYVL